MNKRPDVRADVSPPSELERLYRDQRDRMWRSVLAYAGDPDVAADAVAEAFAQALRRGEAIRSPERWVWRAAFAIAAGELHRRRRTASAQIEEVYEMDGATRDLVVALARLPHKQRTAVVLHHAAGYPAKEIARIIGSTTPGVHVLLSRGRKRLRELLEVDDA